MGSYSELYFANDRAEPKGAVNPASPYLLSKYHVPVFWLALFTPDDIVDVEDDEGDLWPYLVKQKAAALDLFRARENVLISNFPLIDPTWFRDFQRFLDSAPFDFVHLRTQQVGSMVATGPEWRDHLALMLGVFDEPRPQSPRLLERLLRKPRESRSWSTFERFLGTGFAGEAGAKPWPYCGASGDSNPAPWERDES